MKALSKTVDGTGDQGKRMRATSHLMGSHQYSWARLLSSLRAPVGALQPASAGGQLWLIALAFHSPQTKRRCIEKKKISLKTEFPWHYRAGSKFGPVIQTAGGGGGRGNPIVSGGLQGNANDVSRFIVPTGASTKSYTNLYECLYNIISIYRFTVGMSFSLVYGALLTKTNRISRIFHSAAQSARRPSYISPR